MPNALGIIASGRRASTSYSAAVLSDSPRAYYRLGETSGTTAADSSGNSRDGTYVNSPTLGATGLVGDSDTSVDFNGSTQCVTVAYNAAWMEPTSITAEVAFNADTTSGYLGLISRRDTAGAPLSVWSLRVQDGILVGEINVNGSGVLQQVNGATTLIAGARYHAAMTYDSTNLRIYLNGAQDGSGALAGGLATYSAGLRIAVGRNASDYFNGRIDEAAFYGSALSASRILAHAQAGGFA